MMNVNPGSVDQILAVLELYDKDKGFKSALKALKTAHTEAKTTEKEVADHEKRMKAAADKAHRKELNASKALEKLASKKGEIAEGESELALAQSAFTEDMRAKQQEFTNKNVLLAKEQERLKALDGQLKQLQGELLTKSDLLEKEKAEFEAFRAKVRSALAA